MNPRKRARQREGAREIVRAGERGRKRWRDSEIKRERQRDSDGERDTHIVRVRENCEGERETVNP